MPKYEQLEFEYDPPPVNTEVAVAMMSDYGPYWDYYDNFNLVSQSVKDDAYWIEDHYGNVIWGDPSSTYLSRSNWDRMK